VTVTNGTARPVPVAVQGQPTVRVNPELPVTVQGVVEINPEQKPVPVGVHGGVSVINQPTVNIGNSPSVTVPGGVSINGTVPVTISDPVQVQSLPPLYWEFQMNTSAQFIASDTSPALDGYRDLRCSLSLYWPNSLSAGEYVFLTIYSDVRGSDGSLQAWAPCGKLMFKNVDGTCQVVGNAFQESCFNTFCSGLSGTFRLPVYGHSIYVHFINATGDTLSGVLNCYFVE